LGKNFTDKVLAEAPLEALAFGPAAALHTFTYHGDEDNMELCPETLTFDGCPHLTQVIVHISGGWMLELQGDLPNLATLHASSQRYGDHRLYFDGIGAGSSAYALRLRDEQGPLAGQQFCFVGEFRYLNLAKVRHIITRLGGAVVETASPALTYAVLGDEEYAAYEAETPSPAVAEIAALIDQGAATEIVSDAELTGWIIDGWY
jgi:NAD-dependent DNA ligase